MKCPNCKKEIENGSAFCEHCGARIKKSKKGLWITLSVIIVAVVTTIVVITIQEQQEQMAMERYRVEQHQRKVEQQLQAEREARQEAERQAEAQRKAKEEAERQAELARQEAARKAEAERQAEAQRKAKEEAERQAELARQEAVRKAEAERQAEIARQREARRQELLSQGLVDLGLPSGTLWKNANEGGDNARYTYDEAVRKFGNKLPTKQQLEELKNKCTWTRTGSGYKVIGPNGNSIYLPAAGYRYCNGDVSYVGTLGCYWSSTPYDSDDAWSFDFDSDGFYMFTSFRCGGRSVRLVQ